jgi:integrase/recombinase XerC
VRRGYFDAIVAAIIEPYKTMMLLQRAIGLRPGEACRMRVADVSIDTGDIITPRDGKSGERSLCFDTEAECAEALRSWMDRRPSGPYLFGGEKPIRVNTYHITITRCCDRLGLPHFKPYALRHTYATEMMHQREAIADISAALGHASVLTTARYYLHADPATIRRMNAGR